MFIAADWTQQTEERAENITFRGYLLVCKSQRSASERICCRVSPSHIDEWDLTSCVL